MKQLALILALSAALACGQNVTPQKVGEQPATGGNTEAQPQPTAAAPQEFKVGDVIEMGSLTLTVNGVTSPPGTDLIKPEPGKKFVVVDATFENKGPSATTVSTLLQMSLKDSTGQAYKLDPMAVIAVGGTAPDAELAPGETLRGQVGFQVPAEATGLVFVFDASVFGTGKVFVALP